jgi:acyl-CoA thioesterase
MADVVQHVFEQSLRLEGGNGHYELVVPPMWEGQAGIVYGGFTLSCIVRVAGLESTTGRPASLACQFLRPLLIAEPLSIDVTPLRKGRSSDLLHLSVSQAGKLAVDAQLRTSAGTSGPTYRAEPPFDLGDPSSFRLNRDIEIEGGWERVPPFEDHIEIRADWASDASDGVFWSRLEPGLVYDDPYLESARISLFLDQQAPAILNHFGYLFYAPDRAELPWGFTNLDLLVHFHKTAGTDWLCYVSNVIDAVDGVGSAQTRVWSQSGELLATAVSQIAFFPTTGERRFG